MRAERAVCEYADEEEKWAAGIGGRGGASAALGRRVAMLRIDVLDFLRSIVGNGATRRCGNRLSHAAADVVAPLVAECAECAERAD